MVEFTDEQLHDINVIISTISKLSKEYSLNSDDYTEIFFILNLINLLNKYLYNENIKITNKINRIINKLSIRQNQKGGANNDVLLAFAKKLIKKDIQEEENEDENEEEK